MFEFTSEVNMLERRMLDRLAMELHASDANLAALQNGGYYLPVNVIRRTLELMLAMGLRAQVLDDDRSAMRPNITRAQA